MDPRVQSQTVVPNLAALKRRVGRFLTMRSPRGATAEDFIRKVERLGEVAILGGLLRDLCLETNRSFYSDIDIVIDTDDYSGLESLMEEYNARKNSFGGYRLQYNRWKIDLWVLSKTWAFAEGLVPCRSFASLLDTTFFDWDAVVLNLSQSKFYTRDKYLSTLTTRVVDLNLRDNPNELGSVVRALRLLEKRDAKLTYKLSNFVFQGIEKLGVNTILNDEWDSYRQSILSEQFVTYVYRSLKSYLDTTADGLPYSHNFNRQLPLFHK